MKEVKANKVSEVLGLIEEYKSGKDAKTKSTLILRIANRLIANKSLKVENQFYEGQWIKISDTSAGAAANTLVVTVAAVKAATDTTSLHKFLN